MGAMNIMPVSEVVANLTKRYRVATDGSRYELNEAVDLIEHQQKRIQELEGVILRGLVSPVSTKKSADVMFRKVGESCLQQGEVVGLVIDKNGPWIQLQHHGIIETIPMQFAVLPTIHSTNGTSTRFVPEGSTAASVPTKPEPKKIPSGYLVRIDIINRNWTFPSDILGLNAALTQMGENRERDNTPGVLYEIYRIPTELKTTTEEVVVKKEVKKFQVVQ